MTRSTRTRRAFAASVAFAAATLGVTSPADAAGHTVEFDAGQACSFPLGVDVVGGTQNYKEFTDKDGNVVRTLSAGKGSALTFTNIATGATLALRSNGAVTDIAINADGSQVWTTTGHNVLILFPSDEPAGPSTTLVAGRTVIKVDPAFNFTVQVVSGRSTDICAALSA